MCYDRGRLQSYIDGELCPAEMEETREHIDSCEECRREYRILLDNEMLVKSSMEGVLAADRERFDAELAWRKLKMESIKREERKGKGMYMRYKKFLASSAAVLALAALIGISPVRTMAADFLTIFRVDRVSAVVITPEDMRQMEQIMRDGQGLADIRNFGRVEVAGRQETRPVSLGEARQGVDFDLRVPALKGYSGPDLKLVTGSSMTLAMNVDKVNDALQSLGGRDKLPAELDGREFTLVMPPAVIADYTGEKGRITLAQGRGPLVRTTSQADVKSIRNALLGIPALPENLRRQLAAVEDWQHTALIPVKAGQHSEVRVGSSGGVFIRGESPSAAHEPANALVWQKNGIVYALAGEGMDPDTALDIAGKLEKTGSGN